MGKFIEINADTRGYDEISQKRSVKRGGAALRRMEMPLSGIRNLDRPTDTTSFMPAELCRRMLEISLLDSAYQRSTVSRDDVLIEAANRYRVDSESEGSGEGTCCETSQEYA